MPWTALVASTLLVVAGASIAAPAGGAEVTPQDVERVLAGSSVKAQVSALLGPCEDEKSAGASVCDKIETGDNTWLELAVRLADYTDASASIGVCDSIARAARRAPAAVLRLQGRTPRMSRECICLPFVSAEIPVADQYRELRLSHRAIASVRDPALAVPRASCLAYIEPVMNKLQRDLVRARPH